MLCNADTYLCNEEPLLELVNKVLTRYLISSSMWILSMWVCWFRKCSFSVNVFENRIALGLDETYTRWKRRLMFYSLCAIRSFGCNCLLVAPRECPTWCLVLGSRIALFTSKAHEPITKWCPPSSVLYVHRRWKNLPRSCRYSLTESNSHVIFRAGFSTWHMHRFLCCSPSLTFRSEYSECAARSSRLDTLRKHVLKPQEAIPLFSYTA